MVQFRIERASQLAFPRSNQAKMYLLAARGIENI